jgi:hypothetical protein
MEINVVFSDNIHILYIYIKALFLYFICTVADQWPYTTKLHPVAGQWPYTTKLHPVAGQWPYTTKLHPVAGQCSSTTKTIDIAEILQKVVLNTINQSTNQSQTDMVHVLPFILHSSICQLSNCKTVEIR